MPFKVIVAGGRDFANYDLLRDTLDKLLANKADVEIVSGKAKGADSLGERYAAERGYPVKAFPADWNRHGKAAGPKRNAEMSAYTDALVAFWDGASAGTKSMVDLAKQRGLPVRVIRYDVTRTINADRLIWIEIGTTTFSLAIASGTVIMAAGEGKHLRGKPYAEVERWLTAKGARIKECNLSNLGQ